MSTTTRRGWRETVEAGVYRSHRLGCRSSRDRKSGRRCSCPWQIAVPGLRPGTTRLVTVTGSIGEARAERRRLLAEGRPELASELVPGTLDELATAYFRAKSAVLAPATIQSHEESYRLRLALALGQVDVLDLTRARVEVYLAELVARAPSRHMVEKTIKALRAILRAGVEWGWLSSNPAAELRLPRPGPDEAAAVERVLTLEQLGSLLEATAGNARLETLFRMAGEAGLRKGEVTGLRWSDLDLAGRRVTVARAVWQERSKQPDNGPPRKVVKAPKGGRTRRVAISAPLAERLADWFAETIVEGGADAGGCVWPGASGGPMDDGTPGQALLRVLDRAGLVHNPKPRPNGEAPKGFVSFHGLRHTAASIMLSRGVPLIVVSRQLGHSSPQITAEVYAHLLSDSQLDAAAAAFEATVGTQAEVEEPAL